MLIHLHGDCLLYMPVLACLYQFAHTAFIECICCWAMYNTAAVLCACLCYDVVHACLLVTFADSAGFSKAKLKFKSSNLTQIGRTTSCGSRSLALLSNCWLG